MLGSSNGMGAAVMDSGAVGIEIPDSMKEKVPEDNSKNSLKSFGSVTIEVLHHLLEGLKSFHIRSCEPILSFPWLFPHLVYFY